MKLNTAATINCCRYFNAAVLIFPLWFYRRWTMEPERMDCGTKPSNKSEMKTYEALK